jgi:putative endonuclease
LTRQQIGQEGEDQAERYLEGLGCVILERNWHCRYGEIDRIARDGQELVFVEVKVRRSGAFGSPEDALASPKAKRLIRAAWSYLEERGQEEADWRIDVVAIQRGAGGSIARIDHYRNAIPDEARHDPA